MGTGQIFAMVGLVGTIILQAMFSGGLDSPYRVLTFSAFFHVVRLFGGQVGVALMGHFIAEREKLHSFRAPFRLPTRRAVRGSSR